MEILTVFTKNPAFTRLYSAVQHAAVFVSAIPTVEATEAVASAKIDIAQLKRLVIVYKISLYKLATRFADSFKIIAITRSALFNTKCTTNRLAARLRPDTNSMSFTWYEFEITVRPDPSRA